MVTENLPTENSDLPLQDLTRKHSEPVTEQNHTQVNEMATPKHSKRKPRRITPNHSGILSLIVEY